MLNWQNCSPIRRRAAHTADLRRKPQTCGLKKGKLKITDPAQREKTGLEAPELVVEIHSGGDCCGDKEESHLTHDHSPAPSPAPAAKTSSCCDKKHGHKHKHNHDHTHDHDHNHDHDERKPLPGATSVFSAVLGDEVLVSAEESIAHQEHHKKVERTLLLDNLGIAASTLCLIHCMAMPFLIAFLPFMGLQFLEGELAHRVIAFFVFGFAIFAIGPGYLQHRKKQVLYATVFGLTLVAGALLIAGPIFGEKYELPFITTGNLVLVITHLRNRKLCQCAH